MVYKFNVTLNVDARRSSGVTPLDRHVLVDEALTELTSWAPRDRAGAFRDWHRGSLSLVHLQVLTVLEADGGLSMSRLADALDVSVASATGIVDRMERRGLVERRHATIDRRVVDVRLTEGGMAVFAGFAEQRRERLGILLAELGDDELTGLLAGVRALRAARSRLLARAGEAGGEAEAP
jgi:DNA-binding MarR family transcriptional regulator